MDMMIDRRVSNINNEITYFGILLWVEHDAITDRILRLLVSKSYEISEYKLIKKHLDENKDFVELGGGIGFISCVLDNYTSEDAQIISVEPNKKAIELMEIHKGMNNCDYEIKRGAYHPNGQTIDFDVKNNLINSSIYRDASKTEKVRGISIKELCEEYDITNFGLIVDIEGAEADLLLNELEYLENNCDVLILEFHDRQDSIETETKERIRQGREKLEESDFLRVDTHGIVSLYQNDS